MKSFYSTFGKLNKITLFFVWLKNRIKRNYSILCLVEELYDIDGRREQTLVFGRALAFECPIIFVELEHSNHL